MAAESPAPGSETTPVLGAQVSIRVEHLTRAGVEALEDALNAWAHHYLRHEARNQGTYGMQFVSGTIGVDTSAYAAEGLLIWTDTCHVDSSSLNAAPEQQQQEMEAHLKAAELTTPQYNRCTNDAMAEPPAAGWASAALPPTPAAAAAAAATPAAAGGGSAKRLKRTADEAASTDQAAAASPAVEPLAAAGSSEAATSPYQTPAAKRRFMGHLRCFNCGSYAHAKAACPAPLDQERIAAALRETADARQAAQQDRAARFGAAKQRYYETLGGQAPEQAAGPGPYEGLRPGVITEDLAQALGMVSAQHPPPWLDRMRLLGLPPAYMVHSKAATPGSAGGQAKSSSFIVREGLDEEVEEQPSKPAADATADAAQQPPEEEVAQQQQEQQPQEQQESGAGGAAAAAEQEQQQAEQPGEAAEAGASAAAGEPAAEDAGNLQLQGMTADGLTINVQDVLTKLASAGVLAPVASTDAAAADAAPGGGAAAAAAAAADSSAATCAVPFVGFNAPLPEGELSEVWARALAACP